MNPIVYRIQLDAGKPGSQLQINAKAGEHASRKIIATIFKDNEVFTPPSGATAALRAQSESGAKFYNACAISGCEIEYELGSNMLASACFISCEIVVIGANNEVLCSPGFDIYVEDILFSDTVVEQEDEFTALTTALSRVSNIEASEAGRVSAENARVAAEHTRETQESERQSNTASAVQNANAAADRANAAAKSCEDIAGGKYPSHASTHASGGSDPITPSSIGAAAADHTHTPASIGAAAADHTHTPASIGAAAADHTHTPASIGAMGIGADNGAVGTKYTVTIEPDTADNAASIIRIKENATGNTRVLIAANTAENNNEVSQIVLRDGTNVGKVNIQCNTSGAKGIRITDDNNVERIKLHYTTTDDMCLFEIKDENGNDVTLETIGAQGRFLCGRNKTIATSAWASDTTYADYPYRASVALPTITALSFVEIVFSPADATSGNFAPVCDTYAGGVYLYAKAVPDAAITIPTIVVWR